MANLQIIRSKHGFKILSHSNQKHPALVQLAKLLKDANKFSEIKIGIFAVYGGEFSLKKTVFSYISGKIEHMTKRQFNKWLKGDRQIYTPKQPKVTWGEQELDLDNLLKEVVQ